MKAARILAFVMATMMGGCSSVTQVCVGSDVGTGTPPPGTIVTSGQVGIDLRSGSSVGAIAAVVVLGALFNLSDTDSEYHWMPITGKAPAMAEGREINLQDCTRPIERPSANLRCK